MRDPNKKNKQPNQPDYGDRSWQQPYYGVEGERPVNQPDDATNENMEDMSAGS